MPYRPLLFLLLLPVFVFSQSKPIPLSGRVTLASSGRPIEFASVLIRSAEDSSKYFVTTSDSAGEFMFENVTTGNWKLRCSFIGYDIKDTLIAVLPAQKKIHAGNIRLSSAATNLKEVVVAAEKQKAVEFSIDKKIYNVGQDINASSGSATDVLRNIPSVQVDIDGNISMRGAGNVLILVNGKPSPLLAKNAAEALQNFPAGSIERIEIITNPSAKYRPDGTGGIINIVLKQNIKPGSNGSISLNAGNGDRYNGNLSLSYKSKKLNLYGNFSMRRNRHVRHSTIDRSNLDSNGIAESFYTENNQMVVKPLSETFLIGFDYQPDSMNTISLSSSYFHVSSIRANRSLRDLTDANDSLLEKYERISILKPYESEIENTLTWEHKFKKPDHELSFECVKTLQPEYERSYYYTTFSPVTSDIFNNIFLDKIDNPWEVTMDYSNPISEDATLEAGYEGTFNNMTMNYRGESYDTLTDEFFTDSSTSYNFIYKDMRNAVYTTWEQGIEDFGFLIGLRAEQANLQGRVTEIDSAFKNDYFSLYPSAHLKYEFDKGEVGLSYSRRVNRPDGDELNPFPEYDDPRNIQSGNPKLLPEYIHSVELGCELKTKKISFMPTLYYRYTYNGFTTVTKPISDSILLTTQENLANDQAAGLELILSAKTGSWLSGNLSSNIFYQQIDASNLGYSSKRSTFSASSNLSANITLAKHTLFQVNCNYRSEELTPQGRYLANFSMNLGAKQDIGRKLSVIVTLNDVFQSQRRRIELSSYDLIQVSESYRNSRTLFVGIKYRFGSGSRKPKEESLQFDATDK